VYAGIQQLFVQTEANSITLDEGSAQKAASFLSGVDRMEFIKADQSTTFFLPNEFEGAQNLVTFPLHHENQLQGAMLIACPGNCACVTTELDIIDLILTQTTGAIRRSVIHEEEIRELRTRIERDHRQRPADAKHLSLD
jgi:two-component system response regulator HydG